jgi:ATP-binding cassette subfamily F protein 3
MLDIVDLSYRVAGRPLFDDASAFIAEGWKVGMVGRNGTGKSTLLRLIREAHEHGDGAIRFSAGASLGYVAQEAPPIDTPLMQFVLDSHAERAALMAESETATDPHRIADIFARLEAIDAFGAEARAARILTGLGFSQADLARPCREFSGGWRMRAALAGALLAEADLLLLDEPTNYLDLEGAAWLEDYLKAYPKTLILVSHDRDMLNRAVTHVLALDGLKLEVHPGGYDTYLKKKAERAANAVAMKAKQDVERAHLQAFIDRFRAKASKATQAQSRIKRLEKMQDIAVPLQERTTPFVFDAADELASPLVVLDTSDLGYEPGKPVLRQVSLRVDQDDRIVIIGPNGQGKTTLVKSIAARLALLKGARVASREARIGYFSQDQLDQLIAGDSVLDHVRRLDPNAKESAQRARAAQMGFGAEKVNTRVEQLSGGEKVRLLLGLIAAEKPHILILDEPTSHLDIDSREALVHAIHGFEGAVLLITHDVYLAEACAERLWLVHDGRLAPYDGDLTDYRRLVLSADRPGDFKGAKQKSSTPAEANAARKPSPSTLKRKVEMAEADMAKAQAALAALDAQLSDPTIYEGNAQKAQNLHAARDEVAATLAHAEEEWLSACEALDQATRA